MGFGGLAFIGIDTLLGTVHHFEVYLLWAGVALIAIAMVMGAVGILGQFFANQRFVRATSQAASQAQKLPIEQEAASSYTSFIVKVPDGVEASLPVGDGYRFGSSVWAQPWWKPSRRPTVIHIERD